MPLDDYRRKRDFTETPEPSGDTTTSVWEGWTSLPYGQRFCCQMHKATRMHIDFRMEHNGVLMSWPVPKGPSLDPKDKRFAVKTEDHPIDYGEFEGIIPSGYGMGTVLLWDVGTYEWVKESAEDPERQIAKGDIKFRLHGNKLNGEFALVKIGGRRPGQDENAWLMIKKRDDYAVEGFDAYKLNVSVRTGRSLEEISAAGGGDPRELARAARPLRASRLPRTPVDNKKESSAPPTAVEPMLATSADKPFTRDGWVFELKYDGVRGIIVVHNGAVTITGRRGRDETKRYPEAQLLARDLDAKSAVLDAEIVALDEQGRPSFELLQQRMNIHRDTDVARAASKTGIRLACFDVLHLDGRDLTQTALRIRKKTLRDILTGDRVALYADHVERDGETFFAALRTQGLEGMIAKRADSVYQPGRRSPDWLKVKAWQTQSAVICGYTAGRGNRSSDLGSLVLAIVGDDGELRYCGLVGTGFSATFLRNLRKDLDGRRVDTPPLTPVPRTTEKITWVRPEVVCEVRYTEWTKAGLLRHPAFLGLREDITPDQCRREVAGDTDILVTATPSQQVPIPATVIPAPVSASIDDETESALAALATLRANDTWEIAGRRLKLTNLDKVFWPDAGLTKRDMIAHYVRMGPYLLPTLRDRPLSMQVFPDGIHGKSFWRKDKPTHAPAWIEFWTYHGEKTKEYILVNELATLAWAANAGVVDLHPWHSRYQAPDQPDWAVFDLDPFPPATFADVITIAKLVKAALDHFGLKSVIKTSGQTGLQIYVPIDRGPSYREVRDWVESVGRDIGKVVPELVTWEWSVSRRDGKIRIDYTQNIINKTLAAPYSLRPSPGAPVSTPIRWEELDDPALRPDRWTIATIGARVDAVGELFAGAIGGGQSLPRLG